MQTFTDASGDEWTVRLTCADCEREAGEVLGKHDCGSLWLPNGRFYETLLSNARLVYDMLILLSTRDGQRAESLDLDEKTFPAAANALREVVFDFFQSTPTSLLDAQEHLSRFDQNGKQSTESTESPDDSALTGGLARSAN